MNPDYQTWLREYKSLICTMERQQSELEVLLGEKKHLEEQIVIQNDRRVSDVSRLRDGISQLEQEATIGRILLGAKSDLLQAMKQSETSFYEAEESPDDSEFLENLVEYCVFHLLDLKVLRHNEIQQCTKDSCKINDKSDQDDGRAKSLHEEIRKLDLTIEKLTSQKKYEANTLLEERNFVWSQFKKMESDYTVLLKARQSELTLANKTVSNLQLSVESLQSSAKRKDEIIDKQKGDILKLEIDVNNYLKEASSLFMELELLRHSKRSMTVLVDKHF